MRGFQGKLHPYEHNPSGTLNRFADGTTLYGNGPFIGCNNLAQILVAAGDTPFKSVNGVLFNPNTCCSRAVAKTLY